MRRNLRPANKSKQCQQKTWLFYGFFLAGHVTQSKHHAVKCVLRLNDVAKKCFNGTPAFAGTVCIRADELLNSICSPSIRTSYLDCDIASHNWEPPASGAYVVLERNTPTWGSWRKVANTWGRECSRFRVRPLLSSAADESSDPSWRNVASTISTKFTNPKRRLSSSNKHQLIPAMAPLWSENTELIRKQDAIVASDSAYLSHQLPLWVN